MPALDGLRGVAILMVIFTHIAGGWGAALGMYQTADRSIIPAALPSWVLSIAGGAPQGVQLFFVISAFTLVCRCGGHMGDLRSFALRRIAKIGPGYLLAALFYTIACGLSPRLFAPDGTGGVSFVPTSLFAFSWHQGVLVGEPPGAWSIKCEALFYIALPIILYLLDGKIWRSLLLTAVTTLWAAFWVRNLVFDSAWNFATYTNPLVQAPVFLYGICAALIMLRFYRLSAPTLSVVLLVLAVFLLPFWALSDGYFPHHLSFALIAAVVVALSAVTAPKILAYEPLRRIGEVSYSMYLVHFVILAPSFDLALHLLPFNNAGTIALHFTLTTAVSFLAASVMFRYIEQPVVRWAARMTYDKRANPEVRAEPAT